MKKKELMLVTELRKNSRQTLSEMGRILKMPVSTVHDKMKKVRKDIVRKYTCILDFKRLGFNCRGHVVFRLARKADRAVVKEYLLKNQNVNSVYKINNGYDFLVELVFRDMSELDGFLEKMEEKFNIREKKVYYIIEDVVREMFLSDLMHAQMV
ncbi:Lrp/AsnC family transcriptional regulator [Nanoarchaeota archaeon]